MKYPHAGAAILVILPFLLSGCRSPGGEVADMDDSGPAPRVLRIVHAQNLPTLDPHFHETTIGSSVLGNIYEKLVVTDGEGVIVPSLAESWEQLDPLTWSFTIRQDVRFHDGHELTVEDVITSLNRAKNHPESRQANYLVTVERLEVIEGRAVIRTREPDPILLNRVSEISIVAGAPDSEITQPVGTGPFRVAAGGLEGLRLVAFEGYWGSLPEWDAVVILFQADAGKRKQMLLEGEVDLITNLPLAALEEVEAKQWVEWRVGRSVRFLILDLAVKPLSDPRIRRAIDLAIDREALKEKVLKGLGREAGQLAGPGMAGYTPKLAPRAADRVTARKLLRQAVPGGELELTLYHGDAVEGTGELAAQLEAVGIHIARKPLPLPALIKAMKAREASVVLLGWSHSTNDIAALHDAVIHTPDKEKGYGVSNFFEFSNVEIDRLIEDSSAMVVPEDRNAVLVKIALLLAEERYLIPLLRPADLYGINRDIDYFEPRQDGMVWAAEIGRDADRL